MLVSALFLATLILYGISSALYLVQLARGAEGLERPTNAALGAAVVLHVAFLVVDYHQAGHSPVRDIHSTLALLSLGTVVGFLVAVIRYPITVLGAFVTPITLLLFLGSSLGRSVAPVPQEVRSALLPIHVGVNVAGLVALVIAFGASTAYVLQDHMLRTKRLGGVFQRLPSLDVLDSLGFRSLVVGFPLLTVGVITGTIWAVRLNPGMPVFTAAQAMGLVTWTVFAWVLVMRVLAGWQGRRAAFGTIAGFLCALVVLAAYLVHAGAGT
jgi:ABC-type transport system involved in cytochrome c biogenesis permease subunit